MSKRPTSVYTLEFKESSAKLAVESEQPLAQTARELGINKSTLYGWIDKYYPTRKASSTSVNQSPEEELKRLRKENNRLKQERDILKKAAAYFANETS